MGTRNGIYYSPDNGATWQARNTGLRLFCNSQEPPSVYCFFVPSGSEGKEIFAGTVFGLYRSTDDGATWVYVDLGLPGPGIDDRALDVNGIVQIGKSLFAIVSGAVCRSTDNGNKWKPLPFDFMGNVVAIANLDSLFRS